MREFTGQTQRAFIAARAKSRALCSTVEMNNPFDCRNPIAQLWLLKRRVTRRFTTPKGNCPTGSFTIPKGNCQSTGRRTISLRLTPRQHSSRAPMETSHTIVLIQYNLQSSSRTYLDYEGLPRALDGDAHSLLLQPETRI